MGIKKGSHGYFFDTDLYGITGETFALGRSAVEIVKEMMDAGIRIIQYREKEKDKLSKYRDCCEIRKLTENTDVTFIVNDDVDIAIAVGADGIHIGQEDLPVQVVRSLVKDMIIGVSTHNPTQALAAVKDGADYIGVGPLFYTETRKHVEKCDGLAYLQWITENITIPYVAIGGIKEANILQVKENGAQCIAMVTEIIGVPDMKQKVQAIRQILNQQA